MVFAHAELGHQGLPRESSSQTGLAESRCFLLRMSEKQAGHD